MRLRRDVSRLPVNDSTLEWYGRAIDAMKALPRNNPLGWEFQAAVHGIDVVPKEMKDWWAQCQHASSFFLPWHRMYVLNFERIVAAHIARLGGPADWALPYWDYSNPDNRTLPEAFRREQLPDGKPNPLFVKERNPLANKGDIVLSPKDVELQPCLTAEGTPDAGGFSPFFGGPDEAHFGHAPGWLELVPHNTVHAQIGRGGGFMENPNFAALDPIFWLHHSNIDRLWEVWLERDPSHKNLSSENWLTGVEFQFMDANAQATTMHTIDVLDLSAPLLDYRYEDTSDPLRSIQEPFLVESQGPTMPATLHELAGATTTPIQLDGQVTHVDVPTPLTREAFRASRSPNAALTEPPGHQPVPKVMLRLEQVTSSAIAPTFDLYVGVPGSDDPAAYEDRFVARLAMFGIAEASNPTGPHGGAGQDFVFDITKLYGRLADQNLTSPQHLRVSFVPVAPIGTPRVSIGRIGLYFG